MSETQSATLAWIASHPWRTCEECCHALKVDLSITWQEANNAHLYLRRGRFIKKRGKGANTQWAHVEEE